MAKTKKPRKQRRQTQPGTGEVTPKLKLKLYDALTFGGETVRLNLEPARPRKSRRARRKSKEPRP